MPCGHRGWRYAAQVKQREAKGRRQKAGCRLIAITPKRDQKGHLTIRCPFCQLKNVAGIIGSTVC